MRVLDLFAGIGGFSLGLEWAGMQTVAFCEIDEKARKVLRKHWPEVPIYHDVKTLTGDQLGSDGIVPDIIVGGFPCQDISLAGRGAGLDGDRSGLWRHFHRLIKEIGPRWVIIENVSSLRLRGLDEILRSIAEIGYDAEWHCIPASYVGAPHRRDRVWIVAYPQSLGIQGLWSGGQQEPQAYVQSAVSLRLRERSESARWETEPDVDRVVDGLSGRVDRIRQLGNAVVPQIPELLGKKILECEKLLVDMVE